MGKSLDELVGFGSASSGLSGKGIGGKKKGQEQIRSFWLGDSG